MSEVAAVETPVIAVETPVEKTIDFTGRSRSEVIEEMMADTMVPDPEYDDAGEAIIEKVAEASLPDTTLDPVDIPGEKAEAKKEEAVADDSGEKEAADVDGAPGAGKFRVRSADGSFVPVPEVKTEFQIGDKVYTKDHAGLVRMAVDGVKGQQAQEKVRQLESEVIPRIERETQTRLAEAKADLDAMTALNARILADPTGEAWAEAAEKYAEAQSPEAIAKRATAYAQSVQAERAAEQDQQLVRHVVDTYVAPALDKVKAACPDVSEETLTGLLVSVSLGLQGPDGKIPASRYPELVARLNGQYQERALAEQKRISDIKQAASKEREAEKEAAAKALREAQKKQNALSQALKPVGVPAGKTSTEVKEPPAKSRQEAIDRLISRNYEL